MKKNKNYLFYFLTSLFLVGCYSQNSLVRDKDYSNSINEIECNILCEIKEIQEIEKKDFEIHDIVFQYHKNSEAESIMEKYDEKYLNDLQAFYLILKQRKLYLKERMKRTMLFLRIDNFSECDKQEVEPE